MRYDFSRIEDVQSFISVPAGNYVCRVAEVREGTARDGSLRWNLRLEVALGDYAGRTAAWDSLTWSDRGVHRIKLVLAALGFDVRGSLEIACEDLQGRLAEVELVPEEREDPATGARQLRLRVPYAGFRSAPEDAQVGPRDSSAERSGRDGPRRDAARDGQRDEDSARDRQREGDASRDGQREGDASRDGWPGAENGRVPAGDEAPWDA